MDSFIPNYSNCHSHNVWAGFIRETMVKLFEFNRECLIVYDGFIYNLAKECSEYLKHRHNLQFYIGYAVKRIEELKYW